MFTYGSCERVLVIIKHEQHNEISPLAFLLRRESQKSTERSVYHSPFAPIDGHTMSNVNLTRCYGSCERVHVIIKHEHHNEIYPLAFLLR